MPAAPSRERCQAESQQRERARLGHERYEGEWIRRSGREEERRAPGHARDRAVVQFRDAGSQRMQRDLGTRRNLGTDIQVRTVKTQSGAESREPREDR